jgi:hypothetical protein
MTGYRVGASTEQAQPFRGRMQELVFFDHALTSEQIRDRYAFGTSEPDEDDQRSEDADGNPE